MKHFARVALAVACAAWGASAEAAVVEIFTVSNFQPKPAGSVNNAITNVSGYYTTTPGKLSSLTVTENGGGSIFTYLFTAPQLGSGWTQPSQISSGLSASFNFGLLSGPGPVYKNVSVSLIDGIFDAAGGTVTLTESTRNSPGPTPGAGLAALAFLLVAGTSGWARSLRSQ
jgi:hypothetical protein